MPEDETQNGNKVGDELGAQLPEGPGSVGREIVVPSSDVVTFILKNRFLLIGRFLAGFRRKPSY